MTLRIYDKTQKFILKEIPIKRGYSFEYVKNMALKISKEYSYELNFQIIGTKKKSDIF